MEQHISSASISRSSTSKEQMGSAADAMLRASLSRNAKIPAMPVSLNRSGVASGTRVPLIDEGTGSLMPRNSQESPPSLPPTYRSSERSRKQQLKQEVDRANANAIRRNTAGLFRKACSTDLLFLLDTTNSMRPYIEAAKQQIRSIVADIKNAFLNDTEVRIAVVSYKDHNAIPNVEFLDFTTSIDEVHRFLDRLELAWGKDFPEDVLGGLYQALNASWKQQTRCIIHIGDAPPHGSTLHDFSNTSDDYPAEGSEPHGLTYKPVLEKLIRLNLNYAFLRIDGYTDRMVVRFADIYGIDKARISKENKYYTELDQDHRQKSASMTDGPEFEEMQIGTTYSALRHLVVRTVTSSASRSAGTLTQAISKGKNIAPRGLTSPLASVAEDATTTVDGMSGANIILETAQPKWTTPGWLDERLEVHGFCPATTVHDYNTLNDMIADDQHIKLGDLELTIHARSRPFAKGSIRKASYARTAASDNKYVIKSFIKDGFGIADVAEDMRIQALCKAFALEFNSLLRTEPPLDFIVTTCLSSKKNKALDGVNEFLSLEPYIAGEYVKFNSNSGFVNENLLDDEFGQQAQTFSHFTFERSWGHMLVNDLQGVGHILTDPAIQTKSPDKFKLNVTNLGEDGFKFFFATHKCNSYCEKLGLKTTGSMFFSGKWEFREQWPTMDPTLCCSNKLCRKIVHSEHAHGTSKYSGQSWCDECWAQLENSEVQVTCLEPGESHDFGVSRFYCESQGHAVPRKCAAHRKDDRTVSNTAAVGGNLWSKLKSRNSKGSISGKSW